MLPIPDSAKRNMIIDKLIVDKDTWVNREIGPFPNTEAIKLKLSRLYYALRHAFDLSVEGAKAEEISFFKVFYSKGHRLDTAFRGLVYGLFESVPIGDGIGLDNTKQLLNIYTSYYIGDQNSFDNVLSEVIGDFLERAFDEAIDEEPEVGPTTIVQPKPVVEEVCVVDNVNHPSHYNAGKVECIDAIESAVTHLTGIEAVCTGNAIKYLYRWKDKNGLEDLEKARWYLDKLISIVKGAD